MENAKIILEYIKVLIWPLVVIVTLAIFTDDLSKLSERLQSSNVAGLSLSFNTGQGQTEDEASDLPYADVWFDMNRYNLSAEECISFAEKAVLNAGFDTDFKTRDGILAFGYKNEFVGAIKCEGETNPTLITVAGPYKKGLQEKHEQLVSSFSQLLPR